MTVSELQTDSRDDEKNKELLLRLTRRRDDAVGKNQLRDAIRFVANKFGWDVEAT